MVKEKSISGNKLLVFGGVYSNLHALQSLQQVAAAEEIPASNILCTGDIVGYCAFPGDCIEVIRDWEINCIAGNVEIQLRNGDEDCGCDFDENSRCDLFSKQWYPFAQKSISREHVAWLHTIPEHLLLHFGGRKLGVVHGSYFETADFIFKSTPWEKKLQTIKALDCDVVLAGHCGLPFYDVHNKKAWINAGVIGMPANDGDPRTWYAIIEAQKDSFLVHFHQLKYSNKEAQIAMETKGLPKAYAKTLVSGIWDNCDILPEVETQAQGRKISFEGQLYEKS